MPIRKTFFNSGNVFNPRGSNSGVFYKKYSMALIGEGLHDLLMPLPDKIPVNRGETNNIF